MKTCLAFITIAILSSTALSEPSVTPSHPDTVVVTENDVDPDSVRMAAPPGAQANVTFRLRSKTPDEIKDYVRKRVRVKVRGVVVVETADRCTGLVDGKGNLIGLCLCFESKAQAKTLVETLRRRLITDI